jgi:hypothetical protein
MIIKVIGFKEARRTDFAKALAKEVSGIYLEIESIFGEDDVIKQHQLARDLVAYMSKYNKHIIVDLYSPNESVRKHFGNYDKVIMIGDQRVSHHEYDPEFTMPSILDLVYNKNDDFNLSAKMAAKYLKIDSVK